MHNWHVADKLPIHNTNYVLFHMKKTPVSTAFETIEANHMAIMRAKVIDY